MGITQPLQDPGWKILRMVYCDHLRVEMLEGSSTTLAAIVSGSLYHALVVEDSKLKLLCLACFKIALEKRLEINLSN